MLCRESHLKNTHLFLCYKLLRVHQYYFCTTIGQSMRHVKITSHDEAQADP